MPEEIKKNGEGEGADNPTTPQPDAFGVTLNSDGTEVPQSKVEQEEGGDKPKDKTGDDDISKNPVVVELQTKIKEYGENLSNMRQSYEGKITELNKQLADALQGKKPDNAGGNDDENVMFKDIKFSKDLPKEELDDMTDTEIRLFDQNAQNQVAMNEMFKTIKGLNKVTEEKKVEDLNSSARSEAISLAEEAIKADSTLAKDAKELADKIIVEFNEFNNTGISAEVLKARMKKALNNVEGYTPPKEQENKGGNNKNPVKNGGGGGDTSKVDAIVNNLDTENKGDYDL